jgi:hypothetical protein
MRCNRRAFSVLACLGRVNPVVDHIQDGGDGRDRHEDPGGKSGGIFRKTVAQVVKDSHQSANGDRIARGILRSGLLTPPFMAIIRHDTPINVYM